MTPPTSESKKVWSGPFKRWSCLKISPLSKTCWPPPNAPHGGSSQATRSVPGNQLRQTPPSGKTTTLRTISGLLPLLSGTIDVLGKPTDSRRPHRLARRGVSHVADDRSLFPGLTVRENLRMAPGLRRRHRGAAYDRPVDIFAAIAPLMDVQAGLLSGGEQQMLALARAIVSNPRLLLVDEMSLGLAPMIVEEILPVVRRVADELNTAVVMVEQHVHLAFQLADRAIVMAKGSVVLEGDTADLRANPSAIQAGYLG